MLAENKRAAILSVFSATNASFGRFFPLTLTLYSISERMRASRFFLPAGELYGPSKGVDPPAAR